MVRLCATIMLTRRAHRSYGVNHRRRAQMTDTIQNLTAHFATKGLRGAELQQAVLAAGWLMAAMTNNDTACAHFEARYREAGR